MLGVWIKGTSQKEEIVKLIKVKSWESLDEIQYERYKKLKETLMKQIKIIENMSNTGTWTLNDLCWQRMNTETRFILRTRSPK